MPNILAVDTSSALCSIALSLDGTVREDTRKVERKHNEVLLPMLEALFAAADCAPRDLDGISFNAGPGSFTGVRLAASTCQALGLAGQARVLPVSSSRILAQHASALGCEEVVTSVRSRGQLYYLSLYELADPPHGAYTDCLLDDRPSWISVGTPVSGELPPWLDEGFVSLPADQRPAVTLLDIARKAWPEAYVAPAQALPIYVSGDHPWQPQNKSHSP